jgi:hypothetical protein
VELAGSIQNEIQTDGTAAAGRRAGEGDDAPVTTEADTPSSTL